VPLRNINQARGGPLNILPGRILLPGCASLATSIAVALWPYSKPRLAPPIGKSWPESRSRCVEWSKGGAEKKKKLFDACEGADSSTGCQHGLPARAASTSSGTSRSTSRSSSTSMRPLHLLSFGAKSGAPYLPYVRAITRRWPTKGGGTRSLPSPGTPMRKK
jgi:hypothetical protein